MADALHESTIDDVSSIDPSMWAELQYGHPYEHMDHTDQTTQATTQPESTPPPEMHTQTAPLERSNNDPFAKRQGKNLSFSGITMTTQVASGASKFGKRSEGRKIILDNVWGVAPAGITTAIMGTYVHVNTHPKNETQIEY